MAASLCHHLETIRINNGLLQILTPPPLLLLLSLSLIHSLPHFHTPMRHSSWRTQQHQAYWIPCGQLLHTNKPAVLSPSLGLICVRPPQHRGEAQLLPKQNSTLMPGLKSTAMGLLCFKDSCVDLSDTFHYVVKSIISGRV